MALGFGFNKAKTLSAAEKSVQQGKLQNAITEYEKIAKQDPKDLTVLNTIGDLYARLGKPEQATEAFKKVGDAYAADGFVVKAIAMYKKLTKLNPSALDSIVRLAELYTQQGLYNDARAQYTAVADQYLKTNDRDRASGILKKMLDLDPENAVMQAKVADLYLKLGKNPEALEIFFNSAQSLYQRGAVENADEALERVLKLDPNYAPARLLRGQIAMEMGNGARAVENLSKLPDLDSRPEALRPLLQGYVQIGDFDKADPITTKLVEAHNDLTAISLYADALFAASQPERALQAYERNADRFLPEQRQTLIDALTTALTKARESAPALQSMLTLVKKAEVTGHLPREIQESLAHAYVQAGELQKAADLYQELAKAEPENPLHDQNYRQVVARMGKDAATRELTVEEGGQALMVDELEAAPALMQEYPRELADAINTALTDSELFSSYNVPEKAITPLERVLPKAPNDVRLRQRLASLYARMERFADAANSCTVLADVHASAGLANQALQFREMAAKYNEQASAAPAAEVETPLERFFKTADSATSPESPASEERIPFEASSVKEGSTVKPVEQPSVAEFDLSSVPHDALIDPPVDVPSPVSRETDSGNEWEEMLTVEEPGAVQAESGAPSDGGTVQEIGANETPDEIVEEARFYLSQEMMSEAQSTILRLERVTPDHPALEELRIAAGMEQVASAPEIEIQPSEPTLEPKSVVETEFEIEASARASDEVVIEGEPIAAAKESDVLGDLSDESAREDVVLDDLIPEEAAREPASFTAPPLKVPSAAPAVAAPAMSASPSNDPLAGIVSDLEDVLDDVAPVAKKAAVVEASKPASAAAPAPVEVSVSADQTDANSMLSDLLDEFKEDVEEPTEDGDDPDTHYNLGVAFREMGLLDEAIGELQKVCRAVDGGKPFSQPIQAYTWLAQCLVDKGAAQAAIRWYERALKVRGISEDSRMAVYYDMANAFESSGNKKAALDNFMEVYGLNIDYRDVAERIRSLRK